MALAWQIYNAQYLRENLYVYVNIRSTYYVHDGYTSGNINRKTLKSNEKKTTKMSTKW